MRNVWRDSTLLRLKHTGSLWTTRTTSWSATIAQRIRAILRFHAGNRTVGLPVTAKNSPEMVRSPGKYPGLFFFSA
jgi:hypothetical protein